MSTDQQLPPPFEPGAPGTPPGFPGYPGYPTAPAPVQQGTNRLAIVGLILAIFIPLLGLILSIVGTVQAGRRNQKGKGLAIAGIVISLVMSAGYVGLIVAVSGKVGTLTDPGCTTAKSAILDNADKVNSDDDATSKAGLQATVDGLTAAQGKATHDNVRNAVKALNADYSEVANDIKTGTQPPADIQTRLTNDANAFDSLCSVDTPGN
jgi:hypothetical protein